MKRAIVLVFSLAIALPLLLGYAGAGTGGGVIDSRRFLALVVFGYLCANALVAWYWFR